MKEFITKYRENPGRCLLESIIKNSWQMEKSAFLKEMSAGQKDIRDWQFWGIQRYKASTGFVTFLEKLLIKAETQNLMHIANAIYENICDEKGISAKTGKPLNIGSHQKWREDFYIALDIDKQTLEKSDALPATESYAEILTIMSEKENIWRHLGALIALEYIIGKEMENINLGLTNTKNLCAKFSLRHASSYNRSQIVKNRMYVAHHAIHDLRQHFPDLFDSILLDIKENFKEITTIVQQMKLGIITIGNAKAYFYSDLKKHSDFSEDYSKVC